MLSRSPLLAFVLVLGLAGCSKESGDSSATHTAASASAAPAVTSAAPSTDTKPPPAPAPPPAAPSSESAGAAPALPSEFPATFPSYPGAVIKSSTVTQKDGKTTRTVLLETKDPSPMVNMFYGKPRFAGMNINGGTKTAKDPLWISDTTKKTDIRLALIPSASGTTIQLTATPW